MKTEHIWIKFLLIITVQKCAYQQNCLHSEGVLKKHFFVDGHEFSIKIEVSERITHQLVSHILQILLSEVIGYTEVHLIHRGEEYEENVVRTLQKISNCKTSNMCDKIGIYDPEIMINLEVWLPPGFNIKQWIATGEIEDCGPLGPIGRSGWFVTDYTVQHFWETNKTIIDHWQAFKNPVIASVFDLTYESNALQSFTFNPHTNRSFCVIKTCGKDGIYRPPQCLQTGIRCATLLSEYFDSTFQWLKNNIIDLGLLVNIALVGRNLEKIVNKRIIDKKHTLFYHKRPSYLNSISHFKHVLFPDCEDVSVKACEFEFSQLEKIIWSKLKSYAPSAHHVLQALTFSQSDYTALLDRYIKEKLKGYSVRDVACFWINDNQDTWHKWIPSDINKKTTLYIGGIFPLSGTYWKQSGVIPAAYMAINAINNNKSLLFNYTLALLEQDGHCTVDEVMRCFINYVTNDKYKTMVGILGPACSDTVEPIAGVANHFNTIIMSYSAEGALLSDRKKYPYFFRTIPENYQFRYVYYNLFKKLNWHQVAALTEDGGRSPEYVSHLQDLMQHKGMNFIVNRKFPREHISLNMIPYLKDLKKKGAKIIIGDFYDYAARAIMCSAYKLGMTGYQGYQWFLPSWFTSNWFDTNIHNSKFNQLQEHVSCTTEQMIEAINGHMSLSYKYYADSDVIMQEGKTVGEWKEKYKIQASRLKMEVSNYGGYTYDAVWVYAMALDALLQEDSSHVTTLHSSKTTRRLVELLSRTNFTGVTGPLHFTGSSRISEVIIWQWLMNKSFHIGTYRPFSHEGEILELNESSIVWLVRKDQKPDGVSNVSVLQSCPLESFKKFFDVSCEVAIIVSNFAGFSIFLFLICFGFVSFKHRYKQRMKMTENRMQELGLISSSGSFALDGWEMPKDNIVINRKLGEGAFGTVYGGEAFISNKGWTSAAIKTLKVGAKPEEKIDFLNEADKMKQFNHMNIVKLIGVCTVGEPVFIVMEFMLYGDLKTYLLGRRTLVTEIKYCKNDEVSDRRLTNMALDVARGLSFLASKKFVHRDLACRNCLVTVNYSVKIGDFGMCRSIYDSDYYRFNRKGMLPVRWMAPESLNDGVFTTMSDIWSYGILLYEIITFGSSPYQGLSNNQVIEYVKSHKTVSLPKSCKPELESLLLRCWSRCPFERPHATEIVEHLANQPELISPAFILSENASKVEDTNSVEVTISTQSHVHLDSAVSPFSDYKSCDKFSFTSSHQSSLRTKVISEVSEVTYL